MEAADQNLKLWLSSRFESLDNRINLVLGSMEKIEKRHDMCRTHCDETSGEYQRRLSHLEKGAVAIDTEKVTKTSMDERFKWLEDQRIQSQQAFWIRAGAWLTGAIVGSTIISMLLAHYWSKH